MGPILSPQHHPAVHAELSLTWFPAGSRPGTSQKLVLHRSKGGCLLEYNIHKVTKSHSHCFETPCPEPFYHHWTGDPALRLLPRSRSIAAYGESCLTGRHISLTRVSCLAQHDSIQLNAVSSVETSYWPGSSSFNCSAE